MFKSKKMDLLVTWKRFVHSLNEVYFDNLEDGIKRGIKNRFIIEAPQPGANIHNSQFTKFIANTNTKFISNIPKTVFGVFDDCELYIMVNPTEDLTDTKTIWTNNSSVLAILEDYFDRLWFKTKRSVCNENLTNIEQNLRH